MTSLLAILGWVGGGALSGVQPQEPPPVLMNVVSLRVVRRDGSVHYGFGTVVGSLGGAPLIVTANHVLRDRGGRNGAREIDVRFVIDRGTAYVGTSLGIFDDALDVGFLESKEPPRFDELVEPAPLGCPESVGADEPLSFLGQSGRWETSPASGRVVPPLSRHLLLASGLRVPDGTSGSPLIDSDGAMLGVITAGLGIGDTARAIAWDTVRAVIHGRIVDDAGTERSETWRRNYYDLYECDQCDRKLEEFTARLKQADPQSTDAIAWRHELEMLREICRRYPPSRCTALRGAGYPRGHFRLWEARWGGRLTCRCLASRLRPLEQYKDASMRDFVCAERDLSRQMSAAVQSGLMDLNFAERATATDADLLALFGPVQFNEVRAAYREEMERFMGDLKGRPVSQTIEAMVGSSRCLLLPPDTPPKALDDFYHDFSFTRLVPICGVKMRILGEIGEIPFVKYQGRYLLMHEGEMRWPR